MAIARLLPGFDSAILFPLTTALFKTSIAKSLYEFDDIEDEIEGDCCNESLD